MTVTSMNLIIWILFMGNAGYAYEAPREYEYKREGIPLGLISDCNSEILRKTFDYAIRTVNTDLSIPIVGYQETMDFGNIFQGINRLCRLMEVGVGSIIGPSARISSDYLMDMCDKKDVPYINLYSHHNGDTYNSYPPLKSFVKALHDTLRELKWTRFVFLYEKSSDLTILEGLLDFYASLDSIMSVVRYNLSVNRNFKPILRKLRKSHDNHILVIGSKLSTVELLKQARQIGIMNNHYNYLIGNLDFHTYDLEDYKYSDANITGFRLFSADQIEVKGLMRELGYLDESNELEIIQNGSCPITMEMALLYDSVVAFAETTKHLHYSPHSVNCSDEATDVQSYGSTFRNYMRSISLQAETITGGIYFEGSLRKGYHFEVIELQATGLVKVGVWQENTNFTFHRPSRQQPPIHKMYNTMANKTLRVLIAVPNKPYASLVESYMKLQGNDQYEGYSIDLVKELANKLGFNFTFINGGNDYGSFNRTTNTTTGMLKEIVEGRADLAITDLTITSEREEVIDFSIPFMNLGISILYLKPQNRNPTTFSFMDPFSKEVWLYLGLAYLGVSLCFFILGRLSPMEWDNQYPCIKEPDELENQFTINNALWFTTGALLQQGSEIAPKALSTRTVAAIWCFFTLIIVSSYTANLAAFLTIENPISVLDNVQDLSINKGGVEYGAKRTGSTRNFFLTSEEEIYMRMNEYMLSNPHLLTETNQEGVDRVKAGNMLTGKTYAFLMESTSIEYNTQRECKLMKIGEPLDEKGYGIAMVKNWPYRDEFNNALLELQEQGVLAQLKKKWWYEIGTGVCNAKSEGAVNALAYSNLEGIYYVLIVGCSLSIVLGIITWCILVAKKAHNHNVSFVDAFVEEFKVVLDLNNNVRELKSPNSVYSRSRNASLDSNIISIEFTTDFDDGNIQQETKNHIEKAL